MNSKNLIVIYFIFYFFQGSISQNFIYYPIVFLAFLMVSWFVAILFASINVMLRDFKNIVNIALRFLMYGSQIDYAVSFIPARWKDLYFLNPFSTIFSLFHWCLFDLERPPLFAIYWLIGFMVILGISSHLTYFILSKKFTKVI